MFAKRLLGKLVSFFRLFYCSNRRSLRRMQDQLIVLASFLFIAARMVGRKNAPGRLVMINSRRVSRATVALSEGLNPPNWISRKVIESSCTPNPFMEMGISVTKY